MRQLFEADHHRGGLKCALLFSVNKDFFEILQKEVSALVNTQKSSDVAQANHRTNWTNPYGETHQFSLFNTSGRFDDTSTDHSKFIQGKQFHHADRYPTLATFINTFPGLYNMRLNSMGTNSGLSPHEEHIVWPSAAGWLRQTYQFRARFHLPVVTNEQAEMMLDGEYFHFREGNIYLFNNGCIHSAANAGATTRYHLVWDMFVSESMVEFMFSSIADELPNFLKRTPVGQRQLTPLRYRPVRAYATMGWGKRWYHRSRLKYLGVQPHQFQNVYNTLTFWQGKLFGRFRLIDEHIHELTSTPRRSKLNQ